MQDRRFYIIVLLLLGIQIEDNSDIESFLIGFIYTALLLLVYKDLKDIHG